MNGGIVKDDSNDGVGDSAGVEVRGWNSRPGWMCTVTFSGRTRLRILLVRILNEGVADGVATMLRTRS